MFEREYPVRGNRFSRWFARMLLKLFGWRVVNEMFPVPKAVLVGGPHTSNWDGFVTMTAMFAVGLDARIMVKDSAFVGPLGWLLRWVGCVPINRASAQRVVEQSVDLYRQHQKLVFIISPEGTRNNADSWKTGFYRIALAAQVPIVAATADYRKKEVCFAALLHPTGNLEQDLAQLYQIYRPVTARHPQRRSLPLLRTPVESDKKPNQGAE